MRRCVCGHDKTLHAYTLTGLGPCQGQGYVLTEAGAQPACSCERFVDAGPAPREVSDAEADPGKTSGKMSGFPNGA
jgi:hypothetical protein